MANFLSVDNGSEQWSRMGREKLQGISSPRQKWRRMWSGVGGKRV